MEQELNVTAECAEIIDESIRLELNVGDLYLFFYGIFPEDAPFWWRLAEEEKDHAALIRSGKEYFAPLHKFPADLLHCNISELKAANAKIRGYIEEFRLRQPSRVESLNTALSIENSAGELHFQRFMDGTGGTPIEKIFRELNQGDEAHAERIGEYMHRNGIEVRSKITQ